ncbi:MAG: Type secretion system protein precursor [Planctomycetota bacterium]|jgi:general secretion pathway protein G
MQMKLFRTRYPSSPKNRRSGFTLMEVLLVLGILGVIMAMVVPRVLGRQKDAYIQAAKASLGGLSEALKLYALDHGGEFPTTNQGIKALLRRPDGRDPSWKGPYVEKEPRDPWGKPLQYRCPGTHNPDGFDISSSGPDRVHGNADDIGNW